MYLSSPANPNDVPGTDRKVISAEPVKGEVLSFEGEDVLKLFSGELADKDFLGLYD